MCVIHFQGDKQLQNAQIYTVYLTHVQSLQYIILIDAPVSLTIVACTLVVYRLVVL